MNNVFIASKIKVGFQTREDCFTKKLAYIIYYDDKGKLRKETSWNSWRDKDIPIEDYDNVPTDGFTINKDIKRYSGGWFSSNRTMVRIHDPRGFEFEVTTENLIGILMHTDCLRRGLIGQFIYAWVGTELVLLPTNSEEYQNAIKFTTGLSKKVKSKELIPGVSYKTKREGDVIYLGKLNWYKYPRVDGHYSNHVGLRQEKKVMVFAKNDEYSKDVQFFSKNSVEFLSEANSDQPVSNFAELVDKFNKKSYANKIVKYELRPTTFDPTVVKSQYGGHALKNAAYCVQSKIPGVFVDIHISMRIQRYVLNNGRYSDNENDYTVQGYEISDHYGKLQGVRNGDGEIVIVEKDAPNRYTYFQDRLQTLEQIQKLSLYYLYVTFENGKERRVKSVYELTSEDY